MELLEVLLVSGVSGVIVWTGCEVLSVTLVHIIPVFPLCRGLEREVCHRDRW